MYYAARSRENLSNSDKSLHHVNYWACKFSSFWAITGRWDKRRWIWYQHTFGLSDCIFNGWQILGTCVKEFWSPDPSLCRAGQIVSCSALSFQFLFCVNDSAVGWWCSPRNQKDRHLGTQKLCQAWQLHPLHQCSPLWGQISWTWDQADTEKKVIIGKQKVKVRDRVGSIFFFQTILHKDRLI